jgi:TRAP-type C4-dicarboxylate transport system permease small subunit
MEHTSEKEGSLSRAAKGLVQLGRYVAEIALLGMVLLIGADVIMRNVAKKSLLISDEVSGYLLVAMVFFGAGYSLRSGAFLRIEFILFSLPKRARAAIDFAFDLIALALTSILLYELSRFVWRTWDGKVIATTLLETPLWIPQSAMVIGCAIFLVAVLLEFKAALDRLRGRADAAAPAAKPEFEALS